MALKTCSNCGRKFSAARTRCPDCRRRHYGDDDEGPSRLTRIGVVVIAVLLVASVAYNLTRETGPSPEFEALHSAEAAIAQCRRGVRSELSARGVRVDGPLAAEYLGGGEYEVRGAVTLSEGGVSAGSSFLCEAQFRPETGWAVDVEVAG